MDKNKYMKVASGRKESVVNLSVKHLPHNGSDTTSKSFYIKTFGCQMNARDSELVAGLLLKKGYKLAESVDDADIILFNTCCVRQKAEDKVWSEIGKLKQRKAASSPQTTDHRPQNKKKP